MRLLLLSALVLLTACDSSEPDTADLGRFEATFTGDVSASLTGEAVVQTMTFPDGSGGLSITMVPDGALGRPGSMRSLGISDFDGTLTGTGTYPFGADAAGPLGLIYLDFGGDAPVTLTARSGSVTITRFESDRIDGTFAADMSETFGMDDGALEASVEGSFSARRLSAR